MTTIQTYASYSFFAIFIFGDVSILATGITNLYEFIEKGYRRIFGTNQKFDTPLFKLDDKISKNTISVL